MSRKSIAIISSVGIVAIIILLVFFNSHKNKGANPNQQNSNNVTGGPVSQQFIGQAQDFDGATLSVLGYYFSPDGKRLEGDAKTVNVAISSSTKINETLLHFPKPVPTKTPQPVDLNSLGRESLTLSAAQFSELLKTRKGISVTINTSQNIFGQSSFNASDLSFTDSTHD